MTGKLQVLYDDGTKETLTTGDVYFLPKGHTAIVEEDLKMIEFSPSKELGEVMAHVGKKMVEIGG